MSVITAGTAQLPIRSGMARQYGRLLNVNRVLEAAERTSLSKAIPGDA
jgi:hypothetical protein